MKNKKMISNLLKLTVIFLAIAGCQCSIDENTTLGKFVDYLETQVVRTADIENETQRKLDFENELKFAPILIQKNSLEDILLLFDNIFYQPTINNSKESEQANIGQFETQLNIMDEVNNIVQSSDKKEDELFNPIKNLALFDLLLKQSE